MSSVICSAIMGTLLLFTPEGATEDGHTSLDRSNGNNYLKTKEDRNIESGMRLIIDLMNMMDENGDLPKNNCNIVFIGSSEYHSVYLAWNARNPSPERPMRTIIDIPSLASIEPSRSYPY